VDVAALVARAARLHESGVAASDDGRPATAVRRLRAGLDLVDPLVPNGDPALLAVRGRLLISLAWAESERGRVRLGFRVLDQAEPDLPAEQRPVLLAQRALLLKRAGRNDLAMREYDEAVRLLAARANPVELIRALNNRSIAYLDAGDVRSARADLRRCVQLATERELTLYAAVARLNVACLDVLAGNLPAALGGFAAARTDYERLAPGRLAVLAVEQARALLAAGLLDEADRELADAMDRAVRQRLSHVHADALQVRAEAALLAGRPADAARWAGEARARFVERRNARRAALAALLQLRAVAATGEVPPDAVARRGRTLAARLTRLGLAEDARVAGLVAARALLRSGRTVPAERLVTRFGPPGRLDRLDTRLLWRLTRAELAGARGSTAEGARHLVAGMAALHRHRTRFGSLDLQTGAAVHGQDLARAGLATALVGGRPGEIYRWAERARAQALLLPPVSPPADPVAAAALEELRQACYVLRDAELAGRRTGTLRGRIARLRRTVREHSWAAPGQRYPTGPSVAPLGSVRAALGDAALVTYLADGPNLHALVVTGASAALVSVGDRAAAEEAVLRLRADLDAWAGRALPDRLAAAVAAATRRDAGTLATLVLGPLLDRLGDRPLVVVPTGILATVPWSTLPACVGRPVTVAPSATAWLASRSRLEAGNGEGPTVLVAGPGNARGPAEITAIGALRPHAIVLSGRHATPAATLGALSGASVAHLAAHGHHHAQNPLFSALDLAGSPLLGYDLQQVAHPPPMVVLSSCDLGLADVRPGDETLGMATALLAAGSSTVIASVARVADETAMTVMTRYHRGLVAGQPPALALATATATDLTAGFICLGSG
jgi:tetratricopeptide (TPR) repeat protein